MKRVVLVLLLVTLAAVVQAAPLGTAFTYQGKLTNSAGTPLSGSYPMSFKLYDALSGGSQVGSTVTMSSVAVSGGLFTIQLDFGASPLNGQRLWLETTVNGEAISPMVELTAAPYALFAQNAASLAPGVLSNYAGSIQALASPSVNSSVVGSVGATNIGGGYGPVSVAVSGRFACAIDSYGPGGFHIIDVSNPACPFVVSSFDAGSNAKGVAVSGTYAYVTNYSGLKIIDVSDAAQPSVAGSLSLPGGATSSVAVSGRYAYLGAAGGLKVIDVSNPASPSVVGTAAMTCSALAVSGRYAYALGCSAFGQSAVGLQVIDLSNPASPSIVGFVSTGFSPDAVAVSGRYAYVTDWGHSPSYSGNLQVVDISNPAGPSVVGSVGTGSNSFPGPVAVSGRYAYVVNTSSNTLQVIDVSNPGSPLVAGSLCTGPLPKAVAVSGRYAYVANFGSTPAYSDGTLAVIDITGIETTSANIHSLEAGSLQVRGSAFINDQLSVRGGLNVGGSGNFAGTVAANGVALTSDARFKTNVRDLLDPLGSVMKLHGVSFDWKRNDFAERNFSYQPQIGLIAQEVERVYPQLVVKDARGYRAVEYQNLVPVLIEAIKEQQKQIDSLKSENSKFKTRLTSLEKQGRKGRSK